MSNLVKNCICFATTWFNGKAIGRAVTTSDVKLPELKTGNASLPPI